MTLKELKELLASKNIEYKSINKIGYNRFRVDYPDDTWGMYLYKTQVYYRGHDGIVLNTDGYYTRTTKVVINQLLIHDNAKVFAKDNKWYVQYGGQKTEFKDGIKLKFPSE